MVVNLHDEVRSNKRKSILIILMFFAFVGLIGGVGGIVMGLYQTGGFSIGSFIFGLVMAGIVSFIYIMIFYSMGDKMILKATGAIEANRKTYPFLYHTTEALSLAAGMRIPPKCYVIKDTALNAYATGFKPEKSHIVVTTGLMDKLNRQELEGVLAHEMSHIKNQDIKVMLLAAGLVGATVLLADVMFRLFIFSPHRSGGSSDNKNGGLMIAVIAFWILLVVLSPIIGEMIKLAISRRREYLADASGALLTRYPEGLASALEKIKGDPDPLVDNANKATAHLFISTPFRKKKGISGLFATHPPIDDRIKRLRGKNKN
ncbi:MAG: M48 family metallopeptidase [Candidatus Woesearchaeota archaeon]|jgi:heat shock protein HtpX|nr:M48 family metallopeptidase [Candidatus Woesearchaeota archaeon]